MALSKENTKKERCPEHMVLTLCDFLNKYIMKYGRNSPLKWTDLQPWFEKLINHKFISEKASKNKYDGMRKDYNLWKSLKNGKTGLGWNESTRKLECSEEWWEKKPKENPNVKKLWKTQPSIELQEASDRLYEDAVASGVDCVAPSINLSNTNELNYENLEDDDLRTDDDLDTYTVYTNYSTRLEDLESQEDTFYQGFMNEVCKQDVSEPTKIGDFKQPNKSTKMSTKPKPVNMKRKGRESGGTANQKRALEILELDASRDGKSEFDAVQSVVNRMIGEGLMKKGDALWLLAMDIFENDVKRKIFLSIPDDEAWLIWLQHKQTLGT